MKHLMRHAMILGFLSGGLFAADPVPSAKRTASTAINQLVWLAGHWRMEKAGRVVDEQWMAPAAGVMLGMSRTVAKGKVIEHEFVQIREGPGGDLYYIARPSGQKEAAFRILSLTDNEIVFENKEHDFPQKISYRRNSDGSLLAAIEGPGIDGAVRRNEFHYQRVQ